MAFPRCALALVGALLATGAWTPPVQAEEAQLSAVLTLADRPTTAQLHRLASQHPSSAHVTALAPKRSHRDAVVAFARGKHLDVVRADDWSVTVSGPASVLRDALTTGLPPDVASVVGLDNRRLHRAHASPDGLANPQTAASLRAHYDVPASWRGNGITVGVLNLAGWNKGDLQQFADHEGIAVRPGQITTIPVGADPTKLDGFGDEYEVALDAEAVLGSAPEAAQRLYFAPNTSAGVVSGFEQMAADAAAGLVQVVTTSWGSCERDFDETATDSDRAAYASALDRIVAAGATVFAASGDAGAFDCGTPEVPDDEAQVDFPASYGNVVAVGGTTLKAGLPESSWSEPGFAGYLGDGSGGGQSVEQPLPGYQDGIVAGATRRLVPDVASDADPQSGLGIYVRTQGGWSSAGGTSLASPTWAGMLASALSSQGGRSGRGNILPALYASDGFTDVVDGHNGLFSARPGYDLVTGLGVPQWSRLGPALLASSPGASATGPTSFVRRPPRSADPSIRALYTRAVDAPIRVTLPKGSSYTGFSAGERVPGCALQQATPPTTAALLPHPSQGEHQLVLTALDPALVCHQAVANVVYDTVAPTVTVTSDAAARLRLGGVDVTSGIAAWDVSARDDTGKLVYYKVSSDRTRTLSAVKPGGRYTVRVLAHDRAGNTSSPRTLVVTLARDDTSFTKVGPWSRSARTGDYGGTHLASGKPGTALTLTTTTRRLDGYFLTGPNEGYVDVLVDGRRTARLDLYAARSGVARPVLAQWPTVGLHTVRLVATGSHRAQSSGSSVLVDGLLALR